MEEGTVLIAGFSIVDLYPSVKVLKVITRIRSRLERLHTRLDKILESIVNEHRDGKRATEGGKSREAEDLVDVLLRVQKHGDLEFALTDDNIKAVISVSILFLCFGLFFYIHCNMFESYYSETAHIVPLFLSDRFWGKKNSNYYPWFNGVRSTIIICINFFLRYFCFVVSSIFHVKRLLYAI